MIADSNPVTRMGEEKEDGEKEEESEEVQNIQISQIRFQMSKNQTNKKL